MVEGGNLGIYTSELTVDSDSSLSASGLGCNSSRGYGCGYFDVVVGSNLRCGASGGSHGAVGGFPGSEIDQY